MLNEDYTSKDERSQGPNPWDIVRKKELGVVVCRYVIPRLSRFERMDLGYSVMLDGPLVGSAHEYATLVAVKGQQWCFPLASVCSE